jgi:hypothetical protein
MPFDQDESDAGMNSPQRLCVPPWAFPFDGGDLLSVIEQSVESGGKRLRVTRYAEDQIDRQLEVFHEVSDFEGSLVRETRAMECFGALAACGAYVRPLELDVRGEEDRLGDGDQATSSAGDAEETRILIGPTREVAWASDSCTGAEARLGASASLLELRSF